MNVWEKIVLHLKRGTERHSTLQLSEEQAGEFWEIFKPNNVFEKWVKCHPKCTLNGRKAQYFIQYSLLLPVHSCSSLTKSLGVGLVVYWFFSFSNAQVINKLNWPRSCLISWYSINRWSFLTFMEPGVSSPHSKLEPRLTFAGLT